MSIKTWQERLVWITGTSYQGYASQEEIDACKQAELDEILVELVKRDAELEQLTETALWQAGRISELLDDAAAQRKALEQALKTLKVNTTYSEDGRPVYPNDLENHNIITAIQAVLK